eukprot:TRINITY_DN4655_c0_g1_i3.p2 TRINITY_DN4655_c0_g1~~TRINITY_DN4655_c0_g1_i3.p2  ORF type:complete len:569 (-),score=175.29 TRINITY_DN4655_c0_g1_i3:1490-3196(-)
MAETDSMEILESSKPKDKTLELRNWLESADSVMEPQVLEKMKEFFSFGGQPQVAVSSIVENYRGLAQMSNLLGEWLAFSGMSEEEISKTVGDSVRSHITKIFDPKKADTIFSEGAAPPTWLDQMILQQSARSMIYQLSESHRNCLMLNFCLQKISDRGFETELGSLVSASSYYGVFNRAFREHLLNLCTLDEFSLHQALPEFKKICCSSEQTYLYSQFVINSLYQSSSSLKNLKRLSQELEGEMVGKGSSIQNLSFHLSGLSNHPNVAAGISSVLSAQATNPGDIVKLHNIYTGENPPTVQFLRNPQFLDILTRDLFNPHKPINSNYKSKYLSLLAYASCVEDGSSDRTEYKEALRALEIINPICMENSFGSELQSSMEEINGFLSIPVVAQGVLHWIRANFANPDYYTISSTTSCIPLHLELLRGVISAHPLDHPVVLEILMIGFDMHTSWDPVMALDFKKTLLDQMIYLVRYGYLLPVLQVIEGMKVDQSLVRHFILQVLEMIEPPYSTTFLDSFLRTMEFSVEALRATREFDKKKLIQQFLENCSDHPILANPHSQLKDLLTVIG